MRRVLLFVTVGGLGLLIILLVGALLVLRSFFFATGTCNEEERKVYAEFPQYGNINKEPHPFLDTGGCAVRYDTRASQERVAQYYVERLKAHGWQVEQTVADVTVSDPKKRTVDEINITARRGDFFYNVLFESHEYYIPPRPGAHVAVHVFERRNAPPPCGSEEKAVLAEFPHYGGKEVGKELGTFSLRGKPEGFCVTTYPAQEASEEQVLGYYDAKLTEHGWKVQRFPTDRGGRIEGSRDGLRYMVHYSRFPEEHATDVRIEVYRA
jgi:hypothetical protein